jgi:esterase/lipase
MKSISDYILTHLFMWKKFDARKKLKIERIVTNKKKNKKAIMFFPYWTGKSRIYNGFEKKFPDYTLIFYDYPNEVLSENVKVSTDYFKEIISDAFMMIKDLRKGGYTEITLVGSSIGSNIAIKLATIIDVDKVVLNMIDRTLAKEIFYSAALKILKKKLQKHRFSLEKLDQIYNFISIEDNIKLIKNKIKIKLLVFSSNTDIFCTTEDLKPVFKKLDKEKIHYSLEINRHLGHILGIYYNLIFNKKIVNFIKS